MEFIIEKNLLGKDKLKGCPDYADVEKFSLD